MCINLLLLFIDTFKKIASSIHQLQIKLSLSLTYKILLKKNVLAPHDQVPPQWTTAVGTCTQQQPIHPSTHHIM
jgi:hypothetical protein